MAYDGCGWRHCHGKVARVVSSPWLAIVAGIALAGLAAASLLPAEQAPPRTTLPGPVEHFLAYLAVSALAALTFQRHIRFWRLAGLIIGYAALLELAQTWSPGRSPGLIDFAAGSAGAIAAISLSAIVLRRLNRRRGLSFRS